MTGPSRPHRPRPPRVTGARHILAAASYSMGGLARLWRETAFRHEVALLVAALALLGAVGATLVEFCVVVGLFLLLVTVEALNTAIECIVDHVSPDWSEAARDAKDLGSLAVMCVLIGSGLILALIVARHLFEIQL